jgi:hypothetical protein
MKNIAIALLTLLLTACGYENYDVVEYRDVSFTPTMQTVTVYDEEPVDVTTTMITYH